jgi:hypothetical protein
MADAFSISEPCLADSLPLLQVIRSALRQPSGRVVLRVSALAPHRRRVARALMQEGALAAGGVVTDGHEGDLLLVGADAARAGRLRGLLDRLLGSQATTIWSLERDAEPMLAYAGTAAGTLSRGDGAGPTLSGLDVWLRSMPLVKVVARSLGMRSNPADGAARPAFLRLTIERTLLAAQLHGLGADADLLEHAIRTLAARLLQAIGDPDQGRALIGPSLPGPLHLLVPPAPAIGKSTSPSAGRGLLVASTGIEAASDPAALAERRAALAAQGWSLEITNLDAAALHFLALESLPADWLRLSWSPALMAPAVVAALDRVEPSRLILAGVQDETAMAWARHRGIQLLEGPAVAELGANLHRRSAALPNDARVRPASSMPDRPAA